MESNQDPLFLPDFDLAHVDPPAEIRKLREQVEALTVEAKHNSEGWDKALEVAAMHLEKREAIQAALDAERGKVKALTESRDAWKLSQESTEKAYMALVTQIPADRFDYDPANVALLDGAKEQEMIGRKQIADLQALQDQIDQNRNYWRALCEEAQKQLEQERARREAAQKERDTYKELAGIAQEHRQKVCEHRDRIEAELTTLRGLAWAARVELAALFPVPDEASLADASVITTRGNEADARCILAAHAHLHLATLDATPTSPRQSVQARIDELDANAKAQEQTNSVLGYRKALQDVRTLLDGERRRW